MSMSNTGLALIILLSVLFVGFCCCLIICIARNAGYEDEEDEKYESDRSTSDDEPEDFEEPIKETPSIVLGNTESTEDEGIEASLSASSSEDKADIEQPRYQKSQSQSISRSFDSSKQSHETSVSYPANSIDVHVCHSSCCELCRRRHGITFVAAQPLEPKMVDKLQAAPPRWWEFGVSFFDLYQQANGLPRSDAQRRTNDDQNSVWGRLSRTKGSKNKSRRTTKYISSDDSV